MSETRGTPTPCEAVQFLKADGTEILTVEDVAETVAQSARWPGGAADLWGVSIPGSSDVVAYTGNGPNREHNARFIARACNAYADLLEANTVACDLMDLLLDASVLPPAVVARCRDRLDFIRRTVRKAKGEVE